MPDSIFTPNEKAPARTSRGGLEFVLWTATAQPPQKDRTDVHIFKSHASSATPALLPRPPFPLIWSPRFAGTYLLVAGLGGAS